MIEQKETETILHSEDRDNQFDITFWLYKGKVSMDSRRYGHEDEFVSVDLTKQDLLELQQIINQMIEKI